MSLGGGVEKAPIEQTEDRLRSYQIREVVSGAELLTTPPLYVFGSTEVPGIRLLGDSVNRGNDSLYR